MYMPVTPLVHALQAIELQQVPPVRIHFMNHVDASQVAMRSSCWSALDAARPST